jgi:hypothetical protein
MDSKPLELSGVRFSHRSKGYYRSSEPGLDRRGFAASLSFNSLQASSSLFQRFLDKMARVRIQVFGNFFEGHHLTSPKEWFGIIVPR